MSRKSVEYHLIDLSTAFRTAALSLWKRREYARQEGMPAWKIFPSNVRVERHDPRETDRTR